MKSFFRIGVVAFVALALGITSAAAPEVAPMAAPEIKAALIYNFTKFVEWPTNAQKSKATFDIGVMGAPEIAEALEKVVSGKKVGSRSVAVRRLPDIAGMETAASSICILFVGPTAVNAMPDIHNILGKLPVLTVGDSEAFWKAGGMIALLVQNERMRFRVNLDAAEGAGLKISGKLLALATEVAKGTPQ
jgi:hypothetical protein